MKKIDKLKYILTLFLVVVFNGLSYAGLGGGGDPPVPEGDGTQANPIDMYVIWLVAVAIVFIVFFAKKAINKTKQSV